MRSRAYLRHGVLGKSPPDPVRVGEEMARVLTPGGRIVIGDVCADTRVVRIADTFLRRLEPGHVPIYGWREMGSFLHASRLTNLMVRKIMDGNFMIVGAVR